MTTPRTSTLAGREVMLRPAGFDTFWDAQEAVKDSGLERMALYATLAASAFWADTGEQIFADWRAVKAWPMHDSHDVLALLNIAAELNNPTLREAKTNGALAPERGASDAPGVTVHPSP
jgi:hypothetical protein